MCVTLCCAVCFRVFDLDQDGYLSKAELIGAIEASFTVLQQSDHSDVSLSIAKAIK